MAASLTRSISPTVEQLDRGGRLWLAERGVSDAEISARALLASVLGWDEIRLFRDATETVSGSVQHAFAQLLQARANRTPLSHLLGEREFFSLPIRVNGDVLIPRPETEILVEEAISILKRIPTGRKRAWDVGTGSGAIAIALAKSCPEVEVWASDVSQSALRLAAQNARRLGALIHFFRIDLLDDVRGGLDLIVANLPYVPSEEVDQLALDVRNFEPRLALDGGMDGLVFVRRLIEQAAPLLADGGYLLLEIGAGQEKLVVEILKGGDLSHVRTLNDLQGIPRVVVARRGERAWL